MPGHTPQIQAKPSTWRAPLMIRGRSAGSSVNCSRRSKSSRCLVGRTDCSVSFLRNGVDCHPRLNDRPGHAVARWRLQGTEPAAAACDRRDAKAVERGPDDPTGTSFVGGWFGIPAHGGQNRSRDKFSYPHNEASEALMDSFERFGLDER